MSGKVSLVSLNSGVAAAEGLMRGHVASHSSSPATLSGVNDIECKFASPPFKTLQFFSSCVSLTFHTTHPLFFSTTHGDADVRVWRSHLIFELSVES